MISKRLEIIYNLVGNNSKIADIGSDHGYLSIQLAEKKNCLVYSVENKQKPYQTGIKNFQNSTAKNLIIPILGDGINELPDEIDYIIIAGMGGKLITNILKGIKKFKNLPILILQPNKDCPKVREFATKNNYLIENEIIILENGKFYEIIKLIEGVQTMDILDIEFGPILRKEKSQLFLAKYQEEINKKYKIINKISVKDEKYQKIKRRIELIEEVL